MKKITKILSLLLVAGFACLLSACKTTVAPTEAPAPVTTTEEPAPVTTTPEPHTSHTWSDTYQHDADGHWKVCTVCGDLSAVEDHEMVDEVKTKATDQVEGVVTHTCSVCGYTYDENVGLAFVWKVEDGAYITDYESKQADSHFTVSYSEDRKTVHLISSEDYSWNAIVCYASGSTAGYGMEITVSVDEGLANNAQFVIKPNDVEPSWVWNVYAQPGTSKTLCYAGSDIPAEMEKMVVMMSNPQRDGHLSIRWVKLEYATNPVYVHDADDKVFAIYECLTPGFEKYSIKQEVSEPQFANATLDFEELTIGTDYEGSDWTKYQYKQVEGDNWDWVELTNVQNRVRSNDDTNVLLNYAVGGNAMKYYYNEKGEALGFANYFSFKFGNYWSSNVVIKMKLAVVNVDSSITYLAGSASEWVELPVTGKELQKISLYLPEKQVLNVQSFYLCLQASTSTYLYCDDFVMGYYTTDPTIEQKLPEGEVVKFTAFNNGGSGKYSSAIAANDTHGDVAVSAIPSAMNPWCRVDFAALPANAARVTVVISGTKDLNIGVKLDGDGNPYDGKAGNKQYKALNGGEYVIVTWDLKALQMDPTQIVKAVFWAYSTDLAGQAGSFSIVQVSYEVLPEGEVVAFTGFTAGNATYTSAIAAADTQGQIAIASIPSAASSWCRVDFAALPATAKTVSIVFSGTEGLAMMAKVDGDENPYDGKAGNKTTVTLKGETYVVITWDLEALEIDATKIIKIVFFPSSADLAGQAGAFKVVQVSYTTE